jgi:hypothetical protein
VARGKAGEACHLRDTLATIRHGKSGAALRRLTVFIRTNSDHKMKKVCSLFEDDRF